MNASSLKADLFEKLGKNELQHVIVELRKIYNSTSEKYKNLLSIAFRLNSLNSDNRNGILYKGNKDIELNKISSALHEFIKGLTEEDVFKYSFEDQFRISNKNYFTGKNTKMDRPINLKGRAFLFLRLVKYLICLLLIVLLFFIDGIRVLKANMPLVECKFRVVLLNDQIDDLIFQSKMNLALTKLEKNISMESKFHKEVNAMRSRFTRNENEYLRKGIIKESDYFRERQTIAGMVLEISHDLDCDDLN